MHPQHSALSRDHPALVGGIQCSVRALCVVWALLPRVWYDTLELQLHPLLTVIHPLIMVVYVPEVYALCSCVA